MIIIILSDWCPGQGKQFKKINHTIFCHYKPQVKFNSVVLTFYYILISLIQEAMYGAS